MKNCFRYLSCLTIAGAGHVTAQAIQIACPASIQVTYSRVAPVAGWETLKAPSTHVLESAQIYAGHPSQEAELMPDESADDKETQAHWHFPQGDQEFWVLCSYRDTAVMMTKKLSAGLSECVIRSRRLPGSPPGRLQSISCS